jgi:vacuolar-type H+-ATPase subunit I/STV1
MDRYEIDQLMDLLKPFVIAKVHNPNNSKTRESTRVMNIRAIDIDALRDYWDALCLKSPEVPKTEKQRIEIAAARAQRIMDDCNLLDTEISNVITSITANRQRIRLLVEAMEQVTYKSQDETAVRIEQLESALRELDREVRGKKRNETVTKIIKQALEGEHGD